MAKRKLDNLGFGAVAVVIGLVVVAVIAVSGILVYRHSHNKKLASTTSTSTASTASPSQTSSTTQAPAQQYLVIKEWGVQMPLSDSIKDAYYTPPLGGSKSSDGQPNTMLLGLKSLDSNGCGVNLNTSIGLIFRALPSETDSATGRPYTQEYPEGKIIGNYFYAYQFTRNDSCTASQSTLDSVNLAFTQSVKTATPN